MKPWLPYHTLNLRPPTRWERFVRRVTGFFPQSYVDARREALAQDEANRLEWARSRQ